MPPRCLQVHPRRLQDASRTPPGRPGSPPRSPKTSPRGHQTPPRRLQDHPRRPEQTSKTSKSSQRGLQTPPRYRRPPPNSTNLKSQFPARCLPSSYQIPTYAKYICPQWPSSMSSCRGQWSCTKGGLAVVRPRGASSVKKFDLLASN